MRNDEGQGKRTHCETTNGTKNKRFAKRQRRLDLAERELEEIAIIEEFLPKQLAETEVVDAIRAAVASTGASSIRDMGKVMGALKSKYTGQMDFGKVGPLVKDQLCSGGDC